MGVLPNFSFEAPSGKGYPESDIEYLMARSAKMPGKSTMTPVEAQHRLVKRGCDEGFLDELVTSVQLARAGQNVTFPTRLDQIFEHTVGPDQLETLQRRIQNLAKELMDLWTPEGIGFLRNDTNKRWMLELPNLMSGYCREIEFFKLTTKKRLPGFHSGLKSFLVKYVLDSTKGRFGWHDAELSCLCGEELRTWSKWRENHFQPSLPSSREEAPRPIEFLPPPTDPDS